MAMKIKENSVKLGLPASDVQLSEQFQYALNLDPSLDQGDISSKSFKASDTLQSVMKNHCKCSQYMFQVKNAQMPVAYTACVHHPVCLLKEVFGSFRQYKRALPEVF